MTFTTQHALRRLAYPLEEPHKATLTALARKGFVEMVLVTGRTPSYGRWVWFITPAGRDAAFRLRLLYSEEFPR